YDALKNVVGEKEYEKRYVSTGNEFSIEDARAKSLSAADQGAAFVNPQSGVKAEETVLSKLPIKQLTAIAAAAMGATALPGLFGG
ncbi:hypothetical protein, partial [Escherichia coli]|uniref:hypothetical protein n=1 Tax=Escherichia coli TaxID=562 RepID=UPI003F7E810F